ncbi:MAG TPA: efflux RND transporter permease subunit, partial [Gammaproteobacteria bacterium]|nr:efflux RND transporter permease subunit [Gammaproteobacteria bacterium]
DRVSGVIDDLPEEADPPEVQKTSADDQPILWLNLNSKTMSVMELTDYARRYLLDKFSSLDGVARVRIGGAKDKAMRIWLNRHEMAARNLTVQDIEQALRTENVELPAGQLHSKSRDFTVRMQRMFTSPDDFTKLVVARGERGHLVRLGDIAKVEVAPAEERGFFRGNGAAMVGLGIIKQSRANTLDVANSIKKRVTEVATTLPPGLNLDLSYDSSVFIESAIKEVYLTLFIAVFLVILVIYLFLGNLRATLIPAITVPVSLIGTFIILHILGYTINLLTLLALVLAIGLVVDDAIVVLENIYRRIELGEPRLLAAYRGANQVGFAVLAITLVLIAVFIPITFLEGDVGRLFSEFAVAMAASVAFSCFVALTLSPMLASKIIQEKSKHNKLTIWIDKNFERLRKIYRNSVHYFLLKPWPIMLTFFLTLLLIALLVQKIPGEFAPKEDRGVIFLMINAPEGSSYEYTKKSMDVLEQKLMPFVESKEFELLLLRAPQALATTQSFNAGIGIIVLSRWETGRKPIWFYIDKIMQVTSDMPGVNVFPVVRQALGGSFGKPVQFVIGGATYEELVQWRDILIEKARQNPKLVGLDYDYKETKPQLLVRINTDKAGDLGVSLIDINAALETMLGSKRVTTFIDRGEEYDVLVEGIRNLQQSPTDMTNIYVRSKHSQALIPLSSIVTIEEFADAASLQRYNKLRSITIDANLAPDYPLSEALNYLENLVHTELPPGVDIGYKGESLDYKESSGGIYLIFALSLIVVFLVMAGQFESFVHPFVIMFTVPLAVFGALLGLWFFGLSLNIYSQIGLIMLVGLASKNGILMVEFINQLRDEGFETIQAILDASSIRLRPIIMTSFTVIMGAVPLILAHGAGAESRYVLGIVIFFGVLISLPLTLYIIPIVYLFIAKNTQSPKIIQEKLESLLSDYKKVI